MVQNTLVLIELDEQCQSRFLVDMFDLSNDCLND
jgi:hypothetical protein